MACPHKKQRLQVAVERLNRSIRRRLKLHGWINHGGFGHPGPQNKHCDACKRGLGNLEFPVARDAMTQHKDEGREFMGMKIETDVSMPIGQIDISDAKGRRPLITNLADYGRTVNEQRARNLLREMGLAENEGRVKLIADALHIWFGAPAPAHDEAGLAKCKHGDPYCPCQDGDACHYEGENPMPVPERAANEAAQKLRGMLAAGGCMAFTDDYKRQWADRIIKDEMAAFGNQVLNREAARLEATIRLIRTEKECRNPNHSLTNGSACEHEIGPSCMAEAPVSGEAEKLAREIVKICGAQADKFSAIAALLRPRLERAERCAECDKRHAVISNLSMLIRRLIHKHPDNRLREQALDYLRREGLQGSILREALPNAPDTEKKA